MLKPRLAIALPLLVFLSACYVGHLPATAADPPAATTPNAADERPHVVLMIGEDEYGTAETLPEFAAKELEPNGLRCTFIHADEQSENGFPGIEAALEDADLLLLSVRRRTLPESQMAAVRKYLDAGKPLVAIRTSSHAFALRDGEPPAGHQEWKDFDQQVLGGKYENHYGNRTGTDVTSAPHTERNPIMAGVAQPQFHSAGTLYRSRNVPQRNVLLQGLTTDKGEIVTEPVAWTNTYKKGRVFYTSLGHRQDFEIPTFRTILTNAVFWALNLPGPNAEAHRLALEQSEGARSKLNEDAAASAEVLEMMKNFKGKGEIGDDSKPTPPPIATKEFQVHQGFEMELVASEPEIAQPLFMTFDHRGRMWVVQYLQYPFPAGLKVVKYDQYLRAVFDKVPEPPPHGVRGADKITVLEDTTGDGHFDKATDVITGLNITSSVLVGRGGIWVLNPPYLLFYPDRDGNDIPDGDPSVEISGFGLEDTHSVANSMQWGPDGWIYGANGSTSTATIQTAATKDLHFKGQCIWRFHPETKVFEIFGEGGGNTFSFEFDAKGRAFSGTNHGSTRGMHYVQGMYGEKNFGKHGPLTNPYAFGYFRHMKHEGYDERFPQTFLIYEGATWPKEYDHQIVHANSLHNRVQASAMFRDTSTWRTEDTDLLVLTADRWFRPVDLKAGPDGNVYIADWYDSRLTHVDPRDNWHKKSGRIYRLKAEGSKPAPLFDLSKLSNDELLEMLRHDNKWYRQKTQRVIGDRRDTAMLPKLTEWLLNGSDQLALEALWAIYQIGGLDEALTLQALEHRDPHVRRWAVRLVGDSRDASPKIAAKLREMAESEPDVEVRSQLACSAKRLPPPIALPMIRGLLGRSEDAQDIHIPLLLWWAVESKAESGRELLLDMFRDAEVWDLPIVEQTITSRLMRRYALAGSEEDFVAAARLLELAPSAAHKQRLVVGLEEAFVGRVATNLPPQFRQAIADYQASISSLNVALGLRLADPQAIPPALSVVADPQAPAAKRLQYIEILGQIKAEAAVDVLLETLRTAPQSDIRRAILTALSNFEEPRIGTAVVTLCHRDSKVDDEVRAAAYEMLSSRPEWTRLLLEAVDASRVSPQSIPFEFIQRMGMHDDERLTSLLAKHWGQVRSTPAEKQEQIDRLAELIRSGSGDLAAGKQLYTKHCATCHRLFGEGAQTGPELTGYERTNLDFMLLAMVDPSAGIREEYTNFMILTDDGRTLTGFLGDSNERTVSIKGLDGQTQTLPQEQVEVLRALPVSIMPENLLTELSDQQIQDLFAYLMSNPPPSK